MFAAVLTATTTASSIVIVIVVVVLELAVVPGSVPGSILLFAFSSPGIRSASNRNDYQGTSLVAKRGHRFQLTTLPSKLRRMSK